MFLYGTVATGGISMWDIIQNIIVFSIAMGIVRFLVKGIFKLLIIAVVIGLAIYGLNYFDIF